MALTDNLVRYYKMDDNAANTTVLDATSTGNGTSSVNTSTLTAAGKISTSLQFAQASDNEVNCNAAILPTGSNADFTISAWIYPDNLRASDNVIVGQYTGGQAGRMHFSVSSSARLKMFLNGGSTCTSTEDTVSNDVFTHCVLRRSSGTISIWQDGNSQTLDNTTNTAAIRNINTFMASTDAADSGSNINGRIDEVGIWDRALSDAEIGLLYNSGNGLSYPFSTATLRQIKLAGTFVEKPILTKVSGTFVDKPIKIKVGGTFQDA